MGSSETIFHEAARSLFHDRVQSPREFKLHFFSPAGNRTATLRSSEMFEWIAKQQNVLRDGILAVGNAIKWLWLTKFRSFHLFVEETIYDLQSFLPSASGTRTPVSFAILVLITIGTLIVLDKLLARFSSTGRKLKLPTLQMRKGWDYPTLLQQGARKYPNSPYIITYSGYEYVVFPSSAFDEIKKLNASRASMVDWFTQVFWQGWQFLGTDNSARYHMVSIDLTRALPSRVWMRQDNARQAFEAVLGPAGAKHDWTTVPLWGTVQQIVSLMNATGLLGPELGLDPRWLRATQRLHNAIMFGIVGSHLTPRLLRPLVAPMVFLPAKLVDWHMSSLLRPMLRKELESYQAKGLPQEDPKKMADIPASALHQEPSNEKFPLTAWLLDRVSLTRRGSRPSRARSYRDCVRGSDYVSRHVVFLAGGIGHTP